MFEVTGGAGDDNLVIQFNGQQVTVTDHFDTAGEAVEAITFNGSTYEGYILTGDYALSTDDTGTRDAAVGVNTALIGTTGGDTLNGNTGFDLLFGHDGNDALNGGLGEDLSSAAPAVTRSMVVTMSISWSVATAVTPMSTTPART